jgi:anti-sigma factor RsiW
MTCREFANFMLAYSSGEISTKARKVFERHLSVCENCREYLAQYLKAVEVGRRTFAAEDAIAIEAGVPEKLVTAILAARS